MGRQRGVPGSDASLAALPQRQHRTDGQRTVPELRGRRDQPGVTEFRDVPVGLRAGDPTRRGPRRTTVALDPGVLLALVFFSGFFRELNTDVEEFEDLEE